MRKIVAVAVAIAVLAWLGSEVRPRPQDNNSSDVTGEPSTGLLDAIANRGSGIHIEGRGVIAAVLSDDVSGSRHQRLIVRLQTGQTLLIAHNIDVASRMMSPRVGANLEFSGDYEWNEKGGIVHWTHHDPTGRHQSGWLRYEGKLFQ